MRGAGAEVENPISTKDIRVGAMACPDPFERTHLASRRFETKTAGQMKRKGQGNTP